MRPLVPYVELPKLVLVPAGTLGAGAREIAVHPFGLLVAIGVYAGAYLAARYGARRGLSARALASFTLWVVISGFVFGHVLDVVFYDPARIASDPWSLLRLYDGLSSYGGFIGGVIGAFAWKFRQRTAVLPYADVVASALPAGWLFGRAGCAVVHDHPGVASDAWFAVAFPDGGRVDLGLLELILTVPIALAFSKLRARAWPWGFFVALLAIVYGPMRFALDFFRIDGPARIAGVWVTPDARYAGLTPAQWASVVLAIFGVIFGLFVLRSAARASAFLPPPPPRAWASRAASDPDAQRGGQDAGGQR